MGIYGYDAWKLSEPPEYSEYGDAEQPDNRMITLWADFSNQWHAIFGPFKFDLETAVGHGSDMAEAIEDLRACEEAAEEQSLDYFNRYIAGDR